LAVFRVEELDRTAGEEGRAASEVDRRSGQGGGHRRPRPTGHGPGEAESGRAATDDVGLVGREPRGDWAAAAGEAVQGPGDGRVTAARGQGRPRACEASVLVCVRESMRHGRQCVG
jgi:hypothetical protein